jgi:hypothetical protein
MTGKAFLFYMNGEPLVSQCRVPWGYIGKKNAWDGFSSIPHYLRNFAP